MHLKLDKEHKVVFVLNKEDNIREAMNYKIFLQKYNSDLLDVLKKNWEYKTPYHNTAQLDFNI